MGADFASTNAMLASFFGSEQQDARMPGDLCGYYATLLPVRTVGVQGDGRTYRSV